MQAKHKKTGEFVISLDFELFWGMKDCSTINTYGENILGVRNAIPKMIQLFNEFEINATFATVGFLFAKNKKELLKFSPTKKPQYENKNLSSYTDYLEKLGIDETNDKYHFASSLIDLINEHPNHEISTHTFSHYYCLEKGQNVSDFKQGLISAINIAKKKGIVLKSIIFPKNQFNEKYLKTCLDLGINSYRGNEESWIYKAEKSKDETLLKKMFRFSDSYINISGHHCYSIDNTKKNTPYNIPSSRFLRPYSKRLKMLKILKLNRIKKSMNYAAKNGLVYHLWWHPHNFGKNTERNFKILNQILIHYSKLNNMTLQVALCLT
tara:strand:+ start:3318 stop:4286 length:969 start_codon:yes stop_codon:yes gene_type:complete